MTEPIIIALDFPTFEEIQRFLQPFRQQSLYVKVGMELYYQSGPTLVRWLKEQGHRVFLDLKLHDIPNTVYHAMKGLARLGVDMVNVHAAGGVDMMRAARQGLQDGAVSQEAPATLIAVTQLTSTSDQMVREEQLIAAGLSASVKQYAVLAHQAGLAGVVCSALEAPMIHEAVAADFVCVTPGIRLAASTHDDQKRIVTPQQAHQLGSDYLVIGRPIIQAEDPVATYHAICQNWRQS